MLRKARNGLDTPLYPLSPRWTTPDGGRKMSAMKTMFLAAIATSIFSMTPSVASAQAAADTVYVAERRSPFVAGIIETIIPTAGYAYAGDWKRGFLPNAFRLIATVGADIADGRVENFDTNCRNTCKGWITAVVATAGWGIVGSVMTAREHNRNVVRNNAALVLTPGTAGGWRVGVSATWGSAE